MHVPTTVSYAEESVHLLSPLMYVHYDYLCRNCQFFLGGKFNGGLLDMGRQRKLWNQCLNIFSRRWLLWHITKSSLKKPLYLWLLGVCIKMLSDPNLPWGQATSKGKFEFGLWMTGSTSYLTNSRIMEKLQRQMAVVDYENVGSQIQTNTEWTTENI